MNYQLTIGLTIFQVWLLVLLLLRYVDCRLLQSTYRIIKLVRLQIRRNPTLVSRRAPVPKHRTYLWNPSSVRLSVSAGSLSLQPSPIFIHFLPGPPQAIEAGICILFRSAVYILIDHSSVSHRQIAEPYRHCPYIYIENGLHACELWNHKRKMCKRQTLLIDLRNNVHDFIIIVRFEQRSTEKGNRSAWDESRKQRRSVGVWNVA